MKKKEIYKTMMNKDIPNDKINIQTTNAYVDELTQVLENKNKLEHEVYLQEVNKLTEKYFNINLLAIKKSKTECKLSGIMYV